MGPARTDDDASAQPLLALTAAVMAAPVALFRWAPVNDLAEFELLLALLRSFGDPTRAPAAVYRLQPGGANQLLFALSHPLSLALGADLANRLTLAALVAAFPWCLAHAARTFDRSRYLAVAAAPLALGAAFRWGLLGYLLSVALALLALRPLRALVRSPSPRSAALAAAAVALASLAHGSAAVLLALVLVPDGLRALRTPRLAAWIAAPFVPSAALVFAQVRLYDQNANAAFRAATDPEHPRLARFAALPDNLVGPHAGITAVALCALAAGALALLRRGGARADDERPLALTAALVLAQYWLWPYGHNGAGLLYLRFLLPGVWLLALALAPRPGAPSTGVRAALAAVPVAVTLALLPLYQSASANYRAVDRLAPLVTPGSAVGYLDFRGAPLDELGALGRPAAHLVALRGGRTWSFADAPQYPVRTRDEATWPSGLRFANPTNLVPEIDLARYGYLLVVVPEERFVAPLAAALGACARPVAYDAPFALFASRCVRLPLSAPEAPLPPDRPRTVGWRLRHPGAPTAMPR
jgi:hypothetical protein